MQNKISINKDINVAKSMPSLFYEKSLYFTSTINNIFLNSWQFIIDENSFNKKSIYPFTQLQDTINEPLLLTYKNDYTVLSNVCTHRGSILCDNISFKTKIKCPYHGRLFTTDGSVINAPGFDKKNIKKYNLKNYKVKNWNSFLFCSLTGNINIDDVLLDINSRLINYPFNDLQYDSKNSQTYQVDVHWALYCENYLEGFHIPFVHKGLKNDINLNSYKTILLENGVLQYTLSRENKKNNYLNNTYAYYYWIFPNIMLNFYPWGLSMNIIEPIKKNKTRIRFLSFPIKGMTPPNSTPSSLDVVEKEDQEIISKVQRGLLSRAYERGIYSSQYEKGVHHFHRLLCKHL